MVYVFYVHTYFQTHALSSSIQSSHSIILLFFCSSSALFPFLQFLSIIYFSEKKKKKIGDKSGCCQPTLWMVRPNDSYHHIYVHLMFLFSQPFILFFLQHHYLVIPPRPCKFFFITQSLIILRSYRIPTHTFVFDFRLTRIDRTLRPLDQSPTRSGPQVHSDGCQAWFTTK